jgi:uncharacterized membrane protein
MPSFCLQPASGFCVYSHENGRLWARKIAMLGFSMITLSFLIMGIFALFFVAVIVTSLQYERAKRDEHRTDSQRTSRDPIRFPDSDDSLLGRSA